MVEVPVPAFTKKEESAWKHMLHAMSVPAEMGLGEDGVITERKQAREITFRPVINGVKATTESVFGLRNDRGKLEWEMSRRRA